MEVTLENFKKISYLAFDALDGRVVPLLPCYIGNAEWEMWFQVESELTRLPIVDVADGCCYFSSHPVDGADMHSSFISKIVKTAYWPDLVHFERGILEDILNLATSASKVNLFHELWLSDKNKVTSRYVTTELEYIFKVCRSLFDLLQEVIQKIWSRFQYIDSDKKTKKLKSTFSKMLYENNNLSSSEEIAEKYMLPQPLAEFYCRHGVFFDWLRSYRDRISHGGSNIQGLYITEVGFAVSTKDHPFNVLDIWNSTTLQNNGLGSVRTLIAHVILSTLGALDDFATTIESLMQLPPDIAPNHDIYVRGKELTIISDLDSYMNGNEWVGSQHLNGKC